MFKLIASLAVFLVLCANASASLVFNFSFANTTGNIPGTVMGRIFGLVNDLDNQAATGVLIDSFPAGLGGELNEMDAAAWAKQLFNTFNVSSGLITDGAFGAQTLDPNDPIDPNQPVASALLLIGFSNVLSLDSGSTETGNADGFGGVSFSRVPAPATASLALLGLGLAGIRWKYRKRA